MLRPAIQYTINHIYIAVIPKFIHSVAKCRPPIKTKLQYFSGKHILKINHESKSLLKKVYTTPQIGTKSIVFIKKHKTLIELLLLLESLSSKCFSALRNMDSFSLNGGYVPSYVAPPAVVGKPKFVPMVNWRWYVESKEGDTGSVRQSGGGIGKLDAANEDGFFFKLNRSRLRKLKELLKKKGELKKKETPPDKKLYETYE